MNTIFKRIVFSYFTVEFKNITFLVIPISTIGLDLKTQVKILRYSQSISIVFINDIRQIANAICHTM